MRWPGSRRRRSINSADELAELLEGFEWFDGGRCSDVSPAPTASPTSPRRVELTLRDIGEGGLRIGDLRTYRVVRLGASGVREWSVQGADYDHAPEHLISDLDLVETHDGFGFTIDLPSVVRLVATSFECERLPDVSEAFAAWASDRELFVTASPVDLPVPTAWVDTVRDHGIEVGWRTYGSEITPPERVPVDGYDGWFLSRPDRVSEHPGGVQITMHQDATGITCKLQRADDEELWLSVIRSTVDLFPDGEFRSGNCRFNAAEWLRHLTASAGAPPDSSVVNGVAIRSSHLREANPMEVPRGRDPTAWRVRG